MLETKSQDVPHKNCQKPHVLVVDRNEDFARSIVLALRENEMCAKFTRSVDEFLDLNCRARVDLVLLEVDALDPDGLDNLRSLRTYFGEGPGTRIVATSTFAPASFPFLVERRGADIHMMKKRDPQAVVTALIAELNKQPDLT